MLSVSKLYRVDDRIINKYGAAGGIRIGRETGTRRDPTPLPLCPPKIPHDPI
jgi:hypothetical protein